MTITDLPNQLKLKGDFHLGTKRAWLEWEPKTKKYRVLGGFFRRATLYYGPSESDAVETFVQNEKR